MFKDFKAFALKGNVVDLAVAVIIGGAFGKIVTSLVDDLLMPVIGVLLGGVNFSELKYVITPAMGDIAVEAAIYYGSFIQSIVDFIIIAFSIFIIVKIIMSKKKEEADAAPVLPSNEEILLREIRDLLKDK